MGEKELEGMRGGKVGKRIGGQGEEGEDGIYVVRRNQSKNYKLQISKKYTFEKYILVINVFW